jgi:hypothetical protein
MKKTIAKIMAAAMLVASLPAMTMPTLTVEAANRTVSASYVKFNGTYDTGKYFTRLLDRSKGSFAYRSNATKDALILKSADGMTMTGTGIWNTHLQYMSDGITNGTIDDDGDVTNPVTKVGAQTLSQGSASIEKDATKCGDYFDNTGVVKSAALNGEGELILTLDQTKLTDAKMKDLAAGNNNTIEFTPWGKKTGVDSEGKYTYKPVFTIQIGETFTAAKTQITGCSSPDGFITDATVVINADNTATLLKVADNDKKVTMKGQKIEVSEVEVGGVTYPIRKFEEQCLKNAKMKRLTAKQVKNIETGAVRGCKRLTRVTMGNTKIKKIHSNAFLDCEKLKNIKINCKNLKAVGSKAFKGLKKNCLISIKAKKSKYNAVVKMIKKSGTDQVKFKRV